MENNNNSTEKNVGSTNYELKSKAVEELLEAEAGQAPEYAPEELEKYRSRSKLHLSETVKILLIKAWFGGVVCFFFLFGLGGIMHQLDLLFVTAIALGMVTDILLNNILRFMEKEKGGNDRWMMYPKKGMVSFFLNIIHGFVMVFCIYSCYNGINLVLSSLNGGSWLINVEPILFGVFFVVCDSLFIWVKHLLMDLVRKLVDRK